MEYQIPADIVALCNKPSLSDPNEQELVKKEIIKYLKRYLNLKDGKNSLANVSGIIRDVFKCRGTNYPFERDIAGRMMRTKDYTMMEIPNGFNDPEAYVVAADRAWWEKYSGWFTIVLAVFSFAAGLFAEPLRDKVFPKNSTPISLDTVIVKTIAPQIQTDAPLRIYPNLDTVKNDSIIK